MVTCIEPCLHPWPLPMRTMMSRAEVDFRDYQNNMNILLKLKIGNFVAVITISNAE